ncbi:TPA: hypothetical protein ACGO1T_001905 [Streptococcus suis]
MRVKTYKAKKLGLDEWVEGYFFKVENNGETFHMIMPGFEHSFSDKDLKFSRIDPKTLIEAGEFDI